VTNVPVGNRKLSRENSVAASPFAGL